MEREKLVSLVERSQNGDREALNKLIGECYESFFYFALKTVKDENIASDITQESCIEIMTTIGKLHEPAAFIKWSRQIIYHQCTRHFRKKQDVQVEEDEDGYTIFDKLPDESDDSMPEQVYEDKEFRKTIMDLLMTLPEEQRSALLLYYYEKLSVKDIAEIQDVNEGTVKSRLNYGRKAVKKKVEEYEERTGTKLHGMAPLPLLLFRMFKGEMAELPALPAIPNIASATVGTGAAAAGSGAAAGGTAATTTASTTASTAATTVATATAATTAGESVGAAVAGMVAENAATAVGKTLVKTVTASVVTKVIAAILAAVTVGGTIIGGIILSKEKDDNEEHTHEYSEKYVYNDKKHWQVCEDCDERSDKKEHKFEGRTCKVCGYMTASQGLYMVDVGDSYEVGGIGTCTDTDVVIPSEYNGKPVTGFNGWAFEANTTMESIVIPETFTSIGNRVFWRCTSLKKVTLPKNMSYIAEYAFWDCTSLTDIEFPEKLSTIGHFAFSGCLGFEEFEVPDNVKEIGTGAFYECTNLEKVYLPGSIELLSHSAFYQCPNLTDVYFDGTMNQWNKIETDETSFELNGWDDWEDLTFTVHCTDGDLKGAPLPDDGFVED